MSVCKNSYIACHFFLIIYISDSCQAVKTAIPYGFNWCNYPTASGRYRTAKRVIKAVKLYKQLLFCFFLFWQVQYFKQFWHMLSYNNYLFWLSRYNCQNISNCCQIINIVLFHFVNITTEVLLISVKLTSQFPVETISSGCQFFWKLSNYKQNFVTF